MASSALPAGAWEPACAWSSLPWLLAAPPPRPGPGPTAALAEPWFRGGWGRAGPAPALAPVVGPPSPVQHQGLRGTPGRRPRWQLIQASWRPQPRPCPGGSWRPRTLQPELGAELGLLPSAWSPGVRSLRSTGAWCADTCPGLHVCAWPREGSGVLAGPTHPRLLQSPPRKSPAG